MLPREATTHSKSEDVVSSRRSA
jgi:hypothetical protein